MQFDPSDATIAELFATYQAVRGELKKRKIIRTGNAPAGDYAEYLVAKALGGTLAPNSVKSYDLETPDGAKIQIKCRVADETSKSPKPQLSPFRSFAFDYAAIVLFNSDYTVQRAVLVPADHVEALATHHSHINGFIAHARGPLLDRPANRDITSALRAAADGDGGVLPDRYLR